MMERHVFNKWLYAFFAIIIVLAASQASAAKPEGNERFFDIVVKISGLENMLNLVDQVAEAGQTTPSPSTFIRSMLKGTDWIDPARSCVIGINTAGPQAERAVLIPFISPKPDFQSAYNALAGPDYYLVTIPPGPGKQVADGARSALVAASRIHSKPMISVSLGVEKLLTLAEGPIRQGLDKLDHAGVDAPTDAGNMAVSPEVAGKMINSLLDTFGQLEEIRIELDVDSGNVSSRFVADARADTRLARLFTRNIRIKSHLNAYRVDYPVTFRTLSYDIGEAIKLFGDSFGLMYEKIGIDSSKLATICNYFTGEMAGGMNFEPGNIRSESIFVLKEPDSSGEFLSRVYIPWLLDYGRQMTEMINAAGSQKVSDLIVRTADSTIGDHKVVGITLGLPMSAIDRNPAPEFQSLSFEMRMTTVDNLLLVATDDDRLRNLITICKQFSIEETTAPLMTATYDADHYLRAVMSMLPKGAVTFPPVPEMGNVTVHGDFADDSAEMVSLINLEDIKTLISYFKEVAAIAGKSSVSGSPENNQLPHSGGVIPAQASQIEPEKTPEKNARYWYDKGALLETYANHRGAIRCLKKSIELDPEQSNAYFLMGVAFGEIGEFDQAVASINRAIEKKPDNGTYYYARGRVLLLSGNQKAAMLDIRKAAGLGSSDAKAYLNR